MSPYPAQTDRSTIIETARNLIERDGVESLSLVKVAAEFGIKAPSLYGHIRSKSALLQAVIEQTYQRLFDAYDQALAQSGTDPVEQLLNLSLAQRRFAHENPHTYNLAYATQDPELRANPEMLLERAVALQKIMAKVSGEADSLTALRGSLAVVHGFIMLELNGQFRRGGDLSETFETIIRRYLDGWQRGR